MHITFCSVVLHRDRVLPLSMFTPFGRKLPPDGKVWALLVKGALQRSCLHGPLYKWGLASGPQGCWVPSHALHVQHHTFAGGMVFMPLAFFRGLRGFFSEAGSVPELQLQTEEEEFCDPYERSCQVSFKLSPSP